MCWFLVVAWRLIKIDMYVSALLTQEPSVIFSCLLFVGLRAFCQAWLGPEFQEKNRASGWAWALELMVGLAQVYSLLAPLDISSPAASLSVTPIKSLSRSKKEFSHGVNEQRRWYHV